MDKKAESFLEEVLTRLLLTRQRVTSQDGYDNETQSIFEMMLDKIKINLGENKELAEKMKIEFAEYLSEHKKEVMDELKNLLIKRVTEELTKRSEWGVSGVFSNSKIGEKILEKMSEIPRFQEILKEKIAETSEDLGKKIEDNQIRINVILSTKSD